MAQSVVNVVKKEETATAPSAANVPTSNEKAEEVQAESLKKGTHGEDFCCGSCS